MKNSWFCLTTLNLFLIFFLSKKECGRLPFRVPIGSESEINLRPWTVAIVRGGLIAGGRPHCAGVLINDR